jgi:hypothetical protein
MQACYCKMVEFLMRIASIGNKMLAKIYWYKIIATLSVLFLCASSRLIKYTQLGVLCQESYQIKIKFKRFVEIIDSPSYLLVGEQKWTHMVQILLLRFCLCPGKGTGPSTLAAGLKRPSLIEIEGFAIQPSRLSSTM